MTRYKPLQIIFAALMICSLYIVHLSSCENSSLRYLDESYVYSDMRANLEWAQSIRDQGWLNPHPYHPYNEWMQSIAPYSQWVEWWNGEQIFQQSPLYAYLLAGLPTDLLVVRIVQAGMSIAICVLLGLSAARTAGNRTGWLAFWLAALYAPFYLISWSVLRDELGLFVTAALLWTLGELLNQPAKTSKFQRLAWLAGALLGIGFLSRENYLLIIPVVWATLAVLAKKRQNWPMFIVVVIATLLAILPLLIRNHQVGAPLFSSSNRFAETFIHGNAPDSSPYNLVIPQETGQILQQSQGKPLQVIEATIALHKAGAWGWLKLVADKLLSLLDPFESMDNLSIYFVATISPMVHFGLWYWMIIIPGLAGLILTIRNRETANLWLWILFPIILGSVMIGCPLCRYRQSLALLLIPWAAQCLNHLVKQFETHRYRTAGIWLAILATGWLLVQGPLARYPKAQYERISEYEFSEWVYKKLGLKEKLTEIREEINDKFHDDIK